MSHKPLTYFTALSVAAHAVIFGLWPGTEQVLPRLQESSIEIGLVILPQIDKNFSSEKNLSQALPEKLQQEPSRNIIKQADIQPEQIELKPVTVDNSKQAITPTNPEETALPAEGASQPVTTQASSSQPGSNPTTAVEAAPLYATNPAPSYPADALRYGWEGEVWLVVNVNRGGGVSNVSIDKSSGYPILDSAAARTVRKWQFEPARVGSETVEGAVRIPVRFKINRS